MKSRGKNESLHRSYWESVAGSKEFKSPLLTEEIEQRVATQEPILDLGCGYGRVLHRLWVHGYARLHGLDFAEGMIRIARKNLPDQIDLVVGEGNHLPYRDDSFSAVILYLVLTCITDPEIEGRLVQEVHRVLKRSGRVFLEEILIDRGSRRTYEFKRDHHGEYGEFTVDGREQVKHTSEERLASLLSPFQTEHLEHRSWLSMNGHPVHGVCVICRNPAP